MALRLIEMVLPEKDGVEIHELLKEHKTLEYRQIRLPDGDVLVRILLNVEQSEAVLDLLGERAVALLPPLVAFGLLLGSGHAALAMGALSLAMMNLICVNLAGVTTFLVQGIRPATWWEKDRAVKSTRIAITAFGRPCWRYWPV
ncbi:DUF389 domain-containing protein [Thiobacillus sp.]